MGALTGKVAIVTGAAQGIGAAYVRALAAEGASVAIVDLRDPALLAREITAAGGRALGIIADVTDRTAVAKMVAATVAAFGRIDILVNNAALDGTPVMASLLAIEADQFERTMVVNLRGQFQCIKAVVPEMRKLGGGRIVNIASSTAFKGTPEMLDYVASKGGVVAMTRALARELGPDGIAVNALAPGLVFTERLLARGHWTRAMKDAMNASRPIKRDQTPEDVVGALLYLCGPGAGFVTGQTLGVDGGSHMR